MKLLKFEASWCSPCKMMTTMLKDFEGNLLVDEMIKIDIDVDQTTPQKYNVRGVPTLVLVNNTGEAVKTLVGVHNKKAIEEFLNV